MRHLPDQLHNNTKKGQNSTKKNRSLLVHIVELSTTVVKVDTSVCKLHFWWRQILSDVIKNATYRQMYQILLLL